MTAKTIATHIHKHRIYFNDITGGPRLHIYIDGDGSPWIGGARISPDPTPRKPLALELMARDNNSAFYIGRPCHFVVHEDVNCHPDTWTFGRYSASVVASMAAAIEQAAGDIEQVAGAGAASEWQLIGYSGGGTLAVLLAERLPKVTTVVTIAANLDIDRWTQLRSFEPLAGSLNPAERPRLPAGIEQFHLVGDRDRIVPPSVTSAYRRGMAAQLWHYPKFDHTCCWLQHWPQILDRIAAARG